MLALILRVRNNGGRPRVLHIELRKEGKMQFRYVFVALVALICLCLGRQAFAQFTVTITVDEDGHGNLSNSSGFNSSLPFAMLADPGPGGRASALTYGLLSPPGLTAGDLLLLEPGPSGTISDVIRFNPNETIAGTVGALVFYSDNLDGADALADTGFPSDFYANNIARVEVGVEGNNGFSYTPTAGQPGFVTGAGGPITYVIKSDVPEPATFGAALVALGCTALRRRQ